MTENAVNNIAELSEQLNKPVEAQNKVGALDTTRVGPFIAINSIVDKMERETNAPIPTIRSDKNQIDTEDDLKKIRELAYQNGDNIVMRDFVLSSEIQEKYEHHHDAGAEYLKGNPAAHIATYLHELAHYNRNNAGLGHIDYANGETNLALNYVDEKSARVVETLAAVNIYNHCKAEGMDTFTYKDSTIKLDTLLDMYPNLKETIKKHGSDLTNPQTVTEIAKVAGEAWDQYTRPVFEEKEFIQASNEKHAFFSAQIQGVKDGEQAMAAQLKNLDIGYGMKIDLPEECKEIIYPSKEYLHNYIIEHNGKMSHASNEGLLAIDKYLEGKGITSAVEKEAYLKKQYENIVNRAPDTDVQLKDLMLAAEMNPNRGNIIAYTDGLMEKRQGDMQLVSGDKGKTFAEVNQVHDKMLLAQEIALQTGKYPPDAISAADEVHRTLNHRKAVMHIDKANMQQHTEEHAPVETTKTIVNAAMIDGTQGASR